jgi:hypothetical protein
MGVNHYTGIGSSFLMMNSMRAGEASIGEEIAIFVEEFQFFKIGGR